MSTENTTNEARIGLSLLNAGLADFYDAVHAEALQAYQAHIRRLDGISEAPLELPEGALDLFITGYWVGHAAGLKAANVQIEGQAAFGLSRSNAGLCPAVYVLAK